MTTEKGNIENKPAIAPYGRTRNIMDELYKEYGIQVDRVTRNDELEEMAKRVIYRERNAGREPQIRPAIYRTPSAEHDIDPQYGYNEFFDVYRARAPAFDYDAPSAIVDEPPAEREGSGLGWRVYLALLVIGTMAFVGWGQTVRLRAIEAERASPVVQP